ncbi:glycerophosphodiester phosphodiesterase [Metabacillus indicus]|uniref:glycerophosphodiester phosphodiesterase n=1 Tax=Metabacillus indicus TaxID=246786 RepID=UPI0004933583|nr:glycerophosphodiester phosphodiesterase [Metabacillus indicus]KEZ50950.1 hypothetical protein AZ46_0210020 [Metabacillus indicus LMG 22858]
MTIIFGHRGAAGTHPENTMPSFQAAIDLGADGIELDVHLSKDGIPVVIHDETVDRTTNGTGYVKDLTYAELQQLDACYLFPEWSGKASVPSLEQVAEWIRPLNVKVNIELKNDRIHYRQIEEKVISIIEKYNLESRVILSSFNHDSLVTCYHISPHIERGALIHERLYQPWEYAKTIPAASVHPYFLSADQSMIAESQAHGVMVRPYTVNDEQMMKDLMKAGCAGFFTDYPEMAVRIRKSLKNG